MQCSLRKCSKSMNPCNSDSYDTDDNRQEGLGLHLQALFWAPGVLLSLLADLT